MDESKWIVEIRTYSLYHDDYPDEAVLHIDTMKEPPSLVLADEILKKLGATVEAVLELGKQVK